MTDQTQFKSPKIPMPSMFENRLNAIDLSNTTRFENRFSMGNTPSMFDNKQNMPMGIGLGNRSGTGLEIGSGAYDVEGMMQTYDEIAGEQREKDKYFKGKNLYQSDVSDNILNPNSGFFDIPTSTQQTEFNPISQSPYEGTNEVSSDTSSYGITPEFSKEVEKSGFGPIASMQAQPPSVPTIETPKTNLYDTANKTIQAEARMKTEKTPPPQPEQTSGGGGNFSPMNQNPRPQSLSTHTRSRDDTLSMLAQAAHAYPHWMWGIG